MLDLSFVRDHLPQVEAMLRNRGMDPAGVLRDFHEVDTQRRQAITTAEELKAHRNRLSDKIPGMKKSGEDVSQLISETKDMRTQIQELEKAAEEYDARLSEILVEIPNVSARVGASGKICRRTMWKYAAGARRRNSTSRPSRTGNWANSWNFGLGACGETYWRALCGLLGRRCAAGARAGQLHARCSHPRARLH